MKHLHTFESFSMVVTNEEIENKIFDQLINEGFFSKIADTVTNIMDKMDNPKVIAAIKKNIEIYIKQALGNKNFEGFKKEDFENAFKEAENVKWNLKKITDEKIKKCALYLYNRGEKSAEYTSSGGHAFGGGEKGGN